MFGANGLIAYNDGSHGTLFYAFDERGNVAQRVDAGGNVASSDLYDAYGQKLAGNPSGDPYGFGAQVGYRTDAETGLCLLTHRYYDPAAGRFVTRDPAGYGGGINLYSYVQNNPGNSWDPLGLCTIGIGGKFGSTAAGGGFGVSGGVKFDSTGTISLYGSGSVISGFGFSVNAGPTLSFSPGNLPPPDATGLSKGTGTAVGGSATAAPVNVSATFPIKKNGNLGVPTFTLSPGVRAIFGGQVQLGGSVGVNLPVAIQNAGKLFRPIGEPFGPDPFPYMLTKCP